MSVMERAILFFGLVLMCAVAWMTAETMSGLRVETIKAAMPEEGEL